MLFVGHPGNNVQTGIYYVNISFKALKRTSTCFAGVFNSCRHKEQPETHLTESHQLTQQVTTT